MNNINRVGVLFNLITKANKPLSQVFAECSAKWGISKDSVRNIYYNNYDFVKQNTAFCTQHNIDASKLNKIKSLAFSKSSTEDLVHKVQEGTSQGKSVRKVCLELAGGDACLMLRYLNKYRSASKKLLASKQDVLPQREQSSKIIKMPLSQDVLTDSDIQSLFMGLVRLVKNNTIKEMDFAINQKYKEKVLENSTLKNNLTIVKNELAEEKRINLKLQQELNILKQDRLEKYNNLMQQLSAKQKDEPLIN